LYKINEIFLSIQGEGFNVGSLSVFVRFSGCNLSCSFCDTEHEESADMALWQVICAIQSVLKYNLPEPHFCGFPGLKCIFTGGEPLMQLDSEIVEAVIDAGLTPCVETNGTIQGYENKKMLSALELCDDVTISPKSNSVVNKEVLRRATCLKVLAPVEDGLAIRIPGYVEDLGKLRPGYAARRLTEKKLIIQPITPKDGMHSSEFSENCSEALLLALRWKCRYGENWKVIPQTHRIMGLK